MPFTKTDLHAYLLQSSLSEEAKKYVLGASSGPSRDVGTTGYRSMISDFASHKMGTSIATESRTGELAYAVFLEYSDEVIAYYEQPPAVDCIRTDRRARTGARLYHPDFLVLRRCSVEVVQIKTREKISEWASTRSVDWKLEGVRAHDLPAERAFESIGLPHLVICSDEMPRIRTSNLRLLLQARRHPGEVSQGIRRAIHKQLEDVAVQSLAELSVALALLDLTPLLKLIDAGEIYADLDQTLLSDPESCLLSKSPTLLAHMLGEMRGKEPWARSATVDAIPPYKQSEQALKNLERLANSPDTRSARRWRREIARGRESGQSAFYAVLPKTFRSGNREPKRPLQVLAFAEHVIRIYWATMLRPTTVGAYREYRMRAREWHPDLTSVSRPTFSKLLHQLVQSSAFSRGGRRFANAAESPTNVADRSIKALRPFESAICDHYLTDIWCVLLRTKDSIQPGRAWLSVMRDVATGMVLATWLSFRPPSRIACSMLMRSCVRRFGRLPEEIIVDRGADFRSVYFASFLADRGVTLTFRPSGHARYGSEAERFFGLFKTQWLSARPGNINSIKDSRSVSGGHAPKAQATLEVVDLLREVEQYRAWHATWVPAGANNSPDRLMSEGLASYGCSGIRHVFDDAFAIASAVDETNIKLDRQRGLKVGERYYWDPAIGDPSIRASRIKVRRDPEDFTRIYVAIGLRWISCYSSKARLAAASDPFASLAQSIIAHDGVKAREAAREQSDLALVAELRKADNALGSVEVRQASIPDNPESFEELCEADLGSLVISQWKQS